MGGWSLYLQCEGTGSPTVVLDAGLHTGHTVWAPVERPVAQRTRTCSYDRSGVGQSDLRPSRPALVPSRAGCRRAPLTARQGRCVAAVRLGRPFDRGAQRTAVHGTASPGDLGARARRSDEPGVLRAEPVRAGLEGAAIGYDTAYDTVNSARFGNRPAIVLFASSSRAIGEDEARELAERSSNSLLVRTETGHRIQSELPKLVVEAINRVVDSARSRDAIPSCSKTRLERLGGRCVEP